MALTLPVEELTRLQVTFKLSLPDDLFTFEMLSGLDTVTPPPTGCSGYKLHLKGTREGSHFCLKVWAHYEGGPPPPKSTVHGIVDDGGGLELDPTQRTDVDPNTSLGLENDINYGTGHSNPKPVGDTVWYSDYQESDGTQLSDALSYMESPMDGFIGDNWFKENTPSVYLEGINAAGRVTPQIDTHFGKQISRDSQHVPYTNFLPVETGGLPGGDGIPRYHLLTEPESRAIHTPVRTPVDPLSSPSSDGESRKYTSPLSSPNVGPRPYRCLEPNCDRWFKRDYTRKVHMLTHRQKDKKPFCCNFPGCPERFSRKHDRLRHEVGRHGLESEWNCQPCRRFFSSRATMERHIFDKHEQG
ncbi:hypothetical protein AX15_001423 [Amanita polypyramis BW_CC]|nr:hypothetical protein AX15_001423 [Amanita polypyramis BW_CC]